MSGTKKGEIASFDCITSSLPESVPFAANTAVPAPVDSMLLFLKNYFLLEFSCFIMVYVSFYYTRK